MIPKYFSHVILYVTDRCNLQCKTCFVHKGTRDLSLAEAGLIAAKLGRIKWLDIGGGEPFLHPDLVAVCALFSTRSITVPTNGQMPAFICDTVRRLRETVRGEITVAVSLDGFANVNDAIRGADSFEKALETFKRLKEQSGISLKINTVITSENVEQLVPFMKFVRELAPTYHSLLLLRGSPASVDLELPDLDLLEEKSSEILRILKTYDFGHRYNPLFQYLKSNRQRYLWNVCLRTLQYKRGYVPCKAPSLHKVIYPDGRISMCELMPPVGNALTESVEVLERRMKAALLHTEEVRGPCYCTHNCNMGENIMMHPLSVARVISGRTDV